MKKERRLTKRSSNINLLNEHINIMSFARVLKIKNISEEGISFYTPHYPKGDIIQITITLPSTLEIFEERLKVMSDDNEEYVRCKFLEPSKEFIEMLKEYMEINNE